MLDSIDFLINTFLSGDHVEGAASRNFNYVEETHTYCVTLAQTF